MSEKNYLQYFKRVQNGNDVRGAAIATDKEALTISEPLAAYIARAFASYLSEKLGKPASELRIGVGHDSRMSAPQMKAGCLLGLALAKAYDCGLITTPAMFCSTVLPGSNFDGAVMITASHLPFNRNGMKFFTKDGALSKAELTQILEQAAALAGVFAEESPETLLTSDKLPVGDGTVTVFDMKSLYCEHMKEIIRANSGSDEEKPLTGLRIAVDSGNGASGFFASDILEPLGADTEGSQFLNPDGTFPNHVPNPEDKTAMEAIQKATLEHHADLGVIFDCDGVMIDSVAANRIFFDRCLAYYGLPPMTDEQAAYCNMSTSRQGLEHILPERAKKDIPRFGRDIVNYDREILPFIKLYPGFLGFADFLHENGVRMAVLTNRTDNGMKSILDFFSLPSYFNPVVTASCGFPKPQPGGARLILSEWGVGAGDVLYVGDSDVDRRTAEACRMPFAAMNPKENPPLDGDFRVDGYAALRRELAPYMETTGEKACSSLPTSSTR